MSAVASKARQDYIQVPTTAGLWQVRASMFGFLAVHRAPGWERGMENVWTITHIPTGMAAAELVPTSEIRDLLNRLLPLNWDFDHPLRIPKKTYAAALRIIPKAFRPPGPPNQISEWSKLRSEREEVGAGGIT